MKTRRATIALAAVLSQIACGGDVRRNSPGPLVEDDRPHVEDAGTIDSSGRGGTGQTAPDVVSGQDAGYDCAPHNRPICGTMRERVYYTDTGECELYVPHAADDPRPFDPTIVGIQVRAFAGPRPLTHVGAAMDCAGALGWYFVTQPARLVFCPAACDVIRTEAEDVVELLVACQGGCPPPP
jgi:hypothetical protein